MLLPVDWPRPLPARRSLVRQVADDLVDQIALGRWRAGDRLPPEQALADSLGVSRTSIREAIRHLRAQGLVRVEAGRGTFVLEANPSLLLPERVVELIARSPERVLEVQETRLYLELGITELAVQRADVGDIGALREVIEQAQAIVDRDGKGNEAQLFELGLEFHLRLARAARNKLLSSLYALLAEPLRRTVSHAHRSRARPENDIAFHLAVVEAIQRRDVAGALQVMRAHVEQTTAMVVAPGHPRE